MRFYCGPDRVKVKKGLKVYGVGTKIKCTISAEA